MDGIINELATVIQNYLAEHQFGIPDWFAKVVVYIFISIIIFLASKIGKKAFQYFQTLKKIQEIHPFYSKSEIQQKRKHYIPLRIRNMPASNEDYEQSKRVSDFDKDALSWFINTEFHDQGEDRFYMILADAGMGKTTLLINLYLQYSKRIKRKYDIVLLPVGHRLAIEKIRKIKELNRQSKTILLLDAFDEDKEAINNWEKRFDELIEIVEDFREVIFSSRTQFFENEYAEPYKLKIRKPGSEKEYYDLKKMYVAPFSDDDVRRFLNKRFGHINIINSEKKKDAQNIVDQSPNLMVRPMLLAYIDDLLMASSKYKYVFQVYEQLILRWIAREANSIEQGPDEFNENMYKFSKYSAIEIYQKFKEVKVGGNGLVLELNEIDTIAKKYLINLDNLQLQSRSLLNRNSIGQYKFSHKTILEFFLAKEIMTNSEFEQIFDYSSFDQCKKFVKEYNSVQFTLKYFEKENIVPKCKLVDIYVYKHKMKRYVKSITFKEQDFINFLFELDNKNFSSGINELLIEDIVILSDSRLYKIENLRKIYTLRRITIYTNTKRIYNGKLIDLKELLPDCYLAGYESFASQQINSL